MRVEELVTLARASPCQVVIARAPLAMNMKLPMKFQMGCKYYLLNFVVKFFFFYRNGAHLQDALLNELPTIDDIADDEDHADDEVCHKARVADVLCINVGVRVAQLQGSCGEVEVVTIVSMSAKDDLLLE